MAGKVGTQTHGAMQTLTASEVTGISPFRMWTLSARELHPSVTDHVFNPSKCLRFAKSTE